MYSLFTTPRSSLLWYNCSLEADTLAEFLGEFLRKHQKGVNVTIDHNYSLSSQVTSQIIHIRLASRLSLQTNSLLCECD